MWPTGTSQPLSKIPTRERKTSGLAQIQRSRKARSLRWWKGQFLEQPCLGKAKWGFFNQVADSRLQDPGVNQDPAKNWDAATQSRAIRAARHHFIDARSSCEGGGLPISDREILPSHAAMVCNGKFAQYGRQFTVLQGLLQRDGTLKSSCAIDRTA